MSISQTTGQTYQKFLFKLTFSKFQTDLLIAQTKTQTQKLKTKTQAQTQYPTYTQLICLY